MRRCFRVQLVFSKATHSGRMTNAIREFGSNYVDFLTVAMPNAIIGTTRSTVPSYNSEELVEGLSGSAISKLLKRGRESVISKFLKRGAQVRRRERIARDPSIGVSRLCLAHTFVLRLSTIEWLRTSNMYHQVP